MKTREQLETQADPTPVGGDGIPAEADPAPTPPAEPVSVPAMQHAHDLVASIGRQGIEGANFTIEFNGKRYFVSANVESP